MPSPTAMRRPRRPALAAALALSVAAPVAVPVATPPAEADDLGPVVETDICANQLNWYLVEHGLPPLSAMEEGRWTYTVYKVEDGPDQISGYQFFGRPPQCAEGTLVANMWFNCRVSSVYTRGACRLDGVSHSWFW